MIHQADGDVVIVPALVADVACALLDEWHSTGVFSDVGYEKWKTHIEDLRERINRVDNVAIVPMSRVAALEDAIADVIDMDTDGEIQLSNELRSHLIDISTKSLRVPEDD